MKSIVLSAIVLALMLRVNAQSAKYISAMEARVSAMDTVRSSADWQELGNSFERIAEAEKTQWLPFYYASVCHVMTGYMLNNGAPGSGNTIQTDQIADKAEAMISRAEAIQGENSEIYCVKKMIATLRMMADPATRFQTYSPMAAEALSKAKSLDPKNPRVYMLEGQDKFYTPEQFGGSKSAAKSLFEESVKLFETSRPKTSIDPHWGLGQVKYFLARVK